VPESNCLASCSDDRTIRVYDLRSNQLLQHYNAHKGAVNEITFHPTGLYMASCSDDSKVKIWDLRKGKALFSLLSHSGAVNSVDFSFAGDYFCTGGDDKNLLLWRSNFYDSKTREPEIIKPKTKVVNDRVVKFTGKVEVADEPVGGVSPAARTSGVNSPGVDVGMSDPNASSRFDPAQQIVEVQADAKINQNLDKIMNQMEKLAIMLKDMETRVTCNEEDIMKLCNYVKNDVEKARVDYLHSYNAREAAM
jgi:WD40 repeat protein